jgi:DNA-directed RNA polymerase
MNTGNLQQRIATYTNAVVADKEQMDKLEGVVSVLSVDGKSIVAEENEIDDEDVEEVPLEQRTLEASAEGEEPPPKATKVSAKFVELVDLLPPLPQKGDFDVNTIKGSAYFFS